MNYDIIGDIHGQAGKLHGLLARLGYRHQGGAYRHPGRQALFVGDFIDRGPSQLETVMTVRRMVEAGSARAVMGNHEFNAIAWHTPDPDSPGEFLRPRAGERGRRNRDQHGAFLAEVESRPAVHQEVIDWFFTLPLWLDLPELRVVHACWHGAHMKALARHLTPSHQLTPSLLVRASRKDAMEFDAIEAITKGLEIVLPNGHMFQDKDGHARREVRIRWWDARASSYRDLAAMPQASREQLPDTPILLDPRQPCDSAKPVFFGHYWMTGEPAPQSASAACVDYSAARSGPLVAYRWDGEAQLDAGKFVSVG